MRPYNFKVWAIPTTKVRRRKGRYLKEELWRL
jgi:hypothetical protein